MIDARRLLFLCTTSNSKAHSYTSNSKSPFKHILLFQIQFNIQLSLCDLQISPLRSPNSPFAISKQPSPIFKFTLCDHQPSQYIQHTTQNFTNIKQIFTNITTTLSDLQTHPLRSPNSPLPISKFTPCDLNFTKSQKNESASAKTQFKTRHTTPCISLVI